MEKGLNSNFKFTKIRCSRFDTILRSIIFLGLKEIQGQQEIFEKWVELEMEKLDVTMQVGPEQVLVRERENVALGLAVINFESYATPRKILKHLNHERCSS